MNETKLAQNPLRSLIPVIDNRVDAVETHLCKSKGQDRSEGFAHDTLSPERLAEFIADIGPMKSLVEGVKTAGSDEFIVTLESNSPLNIFVSSIPFLQFADKCL